VPTVRGSRRRLGDLLIEAGLLTEQQLKIALNEQRKWGGRLGRTVVEMGFVTETAIGQVLAKQLSLPSFDLDTQQVNAQAATWLRLDICERYGVFPLGINHRDRTIQVATSDPTNLEHLQAIEFATNMKVLPVVATASSIERAIRRYYFGEEPSAPRPPPPPPKNTAPPPAPPPAIVAPPPAVAAGGPPPLRNDTSFELDELLGAPPRKTTEQPAIAIPLSTPTPVPMAAGALSNAIEVSLRREIAVLREKIDALEEINTSQVRALRVLLELLIESGLVTRDEYLEKLHAPD
jgi:type IV pilus assembly protein PilB